MQLTSTWSWTIRMSAGGETLTAPKVDRVNSFDAPTTVAPKPISAKVQGATVALTLEPKSVTVISVEPAGALK